MNELTNYYYVKPVGKNDCLPLWGLNGRFVEFVNDCLAMMGGISSDMNSLKVP